jgi:hypothetical protein
VYLRNPHNVDGLGGREVVVSLVQFRAWFYQLSWEN